ncbi:hypothetical protein MKY34_17750 [Sporosarcina sp. FSL K6-1522]|uniref:hypothetical protein n=1 Tax=Sporosarcina sp. FSL K6-1522 TaxID=2921554 RepID=UPI00315A80D6
MSACKKNCSCNRCKSHRKPCGVVPVSKALKGIDVCQIPKCDCSGRMIIPVSGFTVSICPNCTLQGSSVSIEFLSATFNSTVVNLPQCISIDTGTILQVTGFGTIIDGSSIAQVTFMLQLFDSFVGVDELEFSASGLDQNGNPFTATAVVTGPEVLMVNFCSSCHSSSRKMIHNTVKSQKPQEEFNKGKLVMTLNGQIEEKEL